MCLFSDNRLSRKTPPSYADGVYMMAGGNRPSPRQISERIMKGKDGVGSVRNRTAILAFFGQVGLVQSDIARWDISVSLVDWPGVDENSRAMS